MLKKGSLLPRRAKPAIGGLTRMMKWPEWLILIRHDVSEYNLLKRRKAEDPEYREFARLFDRNPVSSEARESAAKLADRYRLHCGDHDTFLADTEARNAEAVGEALSRTHELPDVVFVSPYLRARETYFGLGRGWFDLTKVRRYDDERIREQEHGLMTLYNDRRIFCAFHPEQYVLREREGGYWYRYPQGENVPDVRRRNHDWLGMLIRDFAGKKVLAVTHHLNILALRANLERWGADQFLEMDEKEKPINCGVTEYRSDPAKGANGHLVLKCYNRKLY